VVAGAQRLIQMQEHLNAINVFPVADSDTGTNMALTMHCVAQAALNCKEPSVHAMSVALANSALMGARGNSGAILAQFFQGLSEGLRGKARTNLAGFADAVQQAAKQAREAIAAPCEGTILTVIQEWAQHIHDAWEKASDFSTLIRSSLQAASDSLQRTPEKLSVLAKAGVVDAGAQGFVYLLEGIQNFVQSGKIEAIVSERLTFGNPKAGLDEKPEQINFRFCTEAFVAGEGMDRVALMQKLRPLGDSMVVAGSSERVRVHIHTNDPERVFAIAREYGEMIESKKEDMRSQHAQAHHHPHAPTARRELADTVAIITDSSCDLPAAEMIRHNIRMVPLGITFGKDFYLDKITMTDDNFYQLLSTSPYYPKTSQPSPAEFRDVYLQAAQNHREAIAIIIASVNSGTFQAAKRAAQGVADKIRVHVIDSRSASAALGLIVREAAEASESGANLSEIKERIDWAIQNVRFFISVETLDYFVRSGRMSKQRGVIARLLNLKPILTMNSAGKMEVVAKTFGRGQARRKLMTIVKREATGKRHLRFLIVHANALETAQYHAAQIRTYFETPEEPAIVSVSPVIGSLSGPGAAAVAFLGEDQ
jgi:hypothetical protein